MVTQNRARPQSATERDHRILFFQGFLKRPSTVGSVIPSSRYMERRIVREARPRVGAARRRARPGYRRHDARDPARAARRTRSSLSIEINPDFLPALRAIGDPRLIVHEGSAVDSARHPRVARPRRAGRRALGHPVLDDEARARPRDRARRLRRRSRPAAASSPTRCATASRSSAARSSAPPPCSSSCATSRRCASTAGRSASCPQPRQQRSARSRRSRRC